ncbi:MAG: hypothetical protein WBM50_24255 [Acidimicrobiales bacterium]
MPELRRLLIGDEPRSWADAGFDVEGGETTIGTISLRFVGGQGAGEPGTTGGKAGGVIGWELTDIEDGSIDGIDSIATSEEPATAIVHPNGVVHLDHVVIMTPDLERTTSSLRRFGFSPRRTREVPGSEPARRQMFIWAGETILEVVGPTEATGSAPAAIWGMALTTTDMNLAAEAIGPHLSAPKPAVQPGRQIATIDTRALGISIALALMTPHVPSDSSSGPSAVDRPAHRSSGA